MAKLLILDRDQYFQGGVRLYRGDAWALRGQVVDRIGGVNTVVDLTGKGVTAFFPGAVSGTVAATAELSNPTAGSIRIPVDELVTPDVQLNPNGIQLYVVVDAAPTGTSPYTAQLPEPDLQIVDREFQQF